MEEKPFPEELKKYISQMKKEQVPLREEMSKWIELIETRYLSEEEFWRSFERPLVEEKAEERSFGFGYTELELTVNQDGTIIIPAEIVRSIFKDPGEKVKVTVTESEEYRDEDEEEYIIWPSIKIE